MDNTKYTTEHRKGQHLLSEERHEIEVRLKDGWSTYRIAKHLGRPYNTIKNEIKRGTVSLYNGKQHRYKADEGKKVYQEQRRNSRKQYRCLASVRFLQYVVVHFKGDDKWSLDASYGKALASGQFRREEMVCTKTLYNYVDLGLPPIKNIDLPEKLRRNTKTKKARENKKNLGRSIEERPEIVSFRTEFGHWEIDTVIGKKDEVEPCVLTLTERMTRMCIWVKARNHTADEICFFADCINGLPRKILDYHTPEELSTASLTASMPRDRTRKRGRHRLRRRAVGSLHSGLRPSFREPTLFYLDLLPF